MDTSFVSILSNVVSGYPYFSLLYILIFWRKIKSDEFYSSLILASNILFSSLTLVVFLYYFIEIFTAWYSGNMYESYAFASRAYGVLNYQFYFGLFLFTLILPLIFWFKYFRRSILATILVSLFILSLMWFESIVSIIISFNRDFLPSKWIYEEPWYIRNILIPFLQMISYGFVTVLFILIRKKIQK
ncbi:MAG TPA: hypothetical protein PLX60_03525 [Chitinophagales bacterium]|jgi:hypothetical protein|nr:hypothetical protein [Chitinophagales bacterium]